MSDQTVQSKFSAVGGGEIQLGITRKPITAWGGMAVFAAFCETVGLRSILECALDGLGRTSPNALPAGDHMLSFMVGVLTGASRFLHLERIRADAPLREMFGIKRFCAPSTYTRFFQSFTRQMREDVFFALGRWALGLLAPRDQGYTLDLDSTVLERFGEQEGVLPGYNPRRHGRPTHHPLLAGLAEAKWILHGWLRAGNAASANNVRAFMEECLALLDGLATLRLVRADMRTRRGSAFNLPERSIEMPSPGPTEAGSAGHPQARMWKGPRSLPRAAKRRRPRQRAGPGRHGSAP